MVDQPGAGGSRSYKIRGYTRERQSAKPYARPPGRRKGVIETVKDFFSPAWLVDFFKGNQRSESVGIDLDDQEEHNEVSQTVDESYSSSSNLRSSRKPTEVSTTTTVGNGQLRSLGPGYFSSILRERGLSSETLSPSRPLRTFGLSSGDNRFGEASTSSARSEESEREVPSSRRVGDSLQPETVEEQEDDLLITHVRQEASTSESIMTSTPALFLNPGSKQRANTSIFGEPLPTAEASTSRRAKQARPQLFSSSSEYHPGPQPFSLPKNRPSFSVSAFGSNIQPKPPQAGEFFSPFYHGRTSFGGAASLHSAGYKRSRTNSPTLGETLQPVRKVITPKPVSTAGSSGVTSQTAKRILEALENMSSPLIDARKIPTPPVSPSASPLSFSPAKRRRPPIPSRALGSPRSLKAHFPGPPVQDLSAPQQAPVSRLRAKETVSPKSTTTSSASLFSTVTTTIPTFSKPSRSSLQDSQGHKPSVPSFVSTPLPVSLSPSSSNTKVGGKVKSARSTSHYTQRDRGNDRADLEIVNPIPEVTTAVPLPLPNGKSLPLFSFVPASQTGKTNSPSAEMLVSANTTSTEDLTKNNFKFSAPSTKVPAFSQELSTVSQSSSNMITFTFSQPTPVNKSVTVNNNKPVQGGQSRSTFSEVQQTEKPVEPNNNLFNRFAPLPGSWECDTCLVSNKATDTKCVACQSSKPSTGKPASPKKPTLRNNDLMQKFAPAAGSLSYDSCMPDNDASKTKCIICETPKPGIKAAFTPLKSINADTDLLKKFTPPADLGSFDTSMVSNKSTDSTCVAYQSPKPGATSTAKTSAGTSFSVSTNTVPDSSLAAKFAPPSGSWECDTCMVNNKGEDTTCIACQTPKPGAKPAAVITTGGFSLPGGPTFSSSPFQFGVNKSSDTNSSAGSTVKFGVDTKSTGGPSLSAPFKLGVDNKSTSQPTSSVILTFGSRSADQNQKTNTEQTESANKLPAAFRFGASPANSQISGLGENKTTSAPTFTFGSSTFNHNNKEETAKFSFGASSSNDKGKGTSDGFKLGDSSTLAKEVKPNSIATAAASGFLKVSGMKEPAKTTPEKSSSQPGAGFSIADAAKSGFLKVPTVGDKKDDFPSPPNVNLFASSQNSTGSTATPETDSGFKFAMPSEASSGVAFGSVSSSAGSLAQGSLGPSTSSGPTSSSGPTAASRVDTSAAPAPSPFSFHVNTVAPTTTTAAASFSLLANAASTTTTPAPFSFGAITVTAASTAATSATPAGTFQFAPSGSAGLFQFGAPDTASVTTAAQPAQQTFGITSTPASSSSEAVKPFAFIAGSTAQGFSFALSNPASTFNFGGSADKQEAGLPVFGAAQSSSNQEAAKQQPTFPGFGAANQQVSASPFLFAPPSNSTSAPSEETMEADGNNSGPNLFGSPANATPTPFGSSGSNTGFAFVAPTPATSGVFNFGATRTNTGSALFAFAPPGGETPAFGASNTPAVNAPAQGGFNFTAASTNNNMNNPGMFNFGSVQPQGNTMFTAGTSGDNPGVAGRKIKKAVRRTKR